MAYSKMRLRISQFQLHKLVEYLDQILSSRCVFAPSSLYALTFWFILKTKTQVRANFVFSASVYMLKNTTQALGFKLCVL